MFHFDLFLTLIACACLFVASESIVRMSVLGRLHSCKSQQKCPLGSLSARRIQELVKLPPDVDYAWQLWGPEAAGGGRCGSVAKQPCQGVVLFSHLESWHIQ